MGGKLQSGTASYFISVNQPVARDRVAIIKVRRALDVN